MICRSFVDQTVVYAVRVRVREARVLDVWNLHALQQGWVDSTNTKPHRYGISPVLWLHPQNLEQRYVEITKSNKMVTSKPGTWNTAPDPGLLY